MKPTAFAAIAALVAVARTTVAQTTDSPQSAADEAVRAAAEAHALVDVMQQNSRIARDALEYARSRRRPDEIRCADRSLSLADAALRHSRDDLAELEAAAQGQEQSRAHAALARIQQSVSASHEAEASAIACSSPQGMRTMDRTTVTLRISPAIVRVEPTAP